MKRFFSFLVLMCSINAIYSQEAVDLGLSVKWANMNVDASTPRDPGGYYAWGEIYTKKEYTRENYKAPRGIARDADYATIKRWKDRGIAGDENYDVATFKWGGYWRMPSLTELRELHDRCQFDIHQDNGYDENDPQSSKYYCKITGPNGNSIILPMPGPWNYNYAAPYHSYRGGSGCVLGLDTKFSPTVCDVVTASYSWWKVWDGMLIRPVHPYYKGEKERIAAGGQPYKVVVKKK